MTKEHFLHNVKRRIKVKDIRDTEGLHHGMPVIQRRYGNFVALDTEGRRIYEAEQILCYIVDENGELHTVDPKNCADL